MQKTAAPILLICDKCWPNDVCYSIQLKRHLILVSVTVRVVPVQARYRVNKVIFVHIWSQCVLHLLFLFLPDDCGHRGWYDSPQSATRHSPLCIIPSVCYNVCEWIMCYALGPGQVCDVTEELLLFIYSVQPGHKFLWLLGFYEIHVNECCS